MSRCSMCNKPEEWFEFFYLNSFSKCAPYTGECSTCNKQERLYYLCMAYGDQTKARCLSCIKSDPYLVQCETPVAGQPPIIHYYVHKRKDTPRVEYLMV